MLLSAALFMIGVVGVLTRRNIIIIFMSIELILNAVNINLIAFSAQLQNVIGQVFAVFVIAVAWESSWRSTGTRRPSTSTR
jgi:NADH-quinone oxidoreductase subunit K